MSAIALGLCGLMLTACGKKDQQQQQAVPELAVMTVGEENATLETGYPATLHGTNDVEIRPQIQGFITQVCVQEGQRVAKGQVLFRIDQVQLQAAVDAAKGQVAQAKAAVEVALANVNTQQTNANNNKLLLNQNIIAPTAYQLSVDALNAAKAQANQARAALSSAQAQLVSAQKNLSYSTITAPASGIVGTIDFKEGALVSPQTLLTVLSNNGEMEAYFSMNEKEVLALTDNGKRTLEQAIAGMPEVSLKLANGEVYPLKGRVKSISGVLDPQTGAAKFVAVFPNTNGMLHSGNTAQVLIPNMTPNAIQIPQKATTEMQDMKFVFTVDKNNMVHRTPITVSDIDDGHSYIVTSGLNPGDVIATEGVGFTLKDSLIIKPKR